MHSYSRGFGSTVIVVRGFGSTVIAVREFGSTVIVVRLADYSVHIQKVVDDVNNFIPDVNFSGLAVIDWERWRPIFERNNYNEEQRVYIRASEAQVRKLHPDWSVKQVHSHAETEFQQAARRLMEGTLVTCRQLRPRGHWGFYGFPACYNYHKGESTCSNETKSLNDRLDWLFNISSVLLPSIYLSEKIGTHNARQARAHGELGEALRVANAYSVHNTPLVAYSRFRYGDTGRFYDLADLNNTLRQSAEAGFSGVALWDSSESFKTRTECEATKAYLDNQLGPYIRELSKDALECSRNICSGHGRCVNTTFGIYYTNLHSKFFSKSHGYRVYKYLKNTALDLITSILEGFKTVLRLILNDELKGKTVSCVCFNGWKGENCSRKE
ncbi:hyaluronidase-1-like [Mya arenaria]|uniref:hyaluronidase-1-like n=1 Tax=Mya arenaria TaxID=6604 RepID=UPI0022E6B331|nr:hyaluronidase-1-like [Mya arenaria]